MKRLSVLKFLGQETSMRAHEFLHDFYMIFTQRLQLEQLFHNIKYSDFLYALVWYSTVLLGVLTCYTSQIYQ